ncbi:MAG: hypothetical protein V4793_00385 [Paraburkholderia tropica]|uniref:Lipoprotein n=1 Tax=Paraburkholderia tropica TaxID=92647 RepID=A0ABX5MPD3_9BURK|nr:hypothetical protein [Paraburkholderia tropica]PXX12516.1 hypothetical protein C7400_117120 [Paraburkholderia tropica]PZW76493.1 hypothetical protein C7399_118118 [Paraburkholderia tropica]
MKNHRYARVSHLVVPTLLTLLLAACGNSAPSESAAKQAVQAQLGDCKYVDMSDFNRVNGAQGGDDRHYQVEVQYNLTLEADSSQKDKLEDWVKKTSERQDLIKEQMEILKSYQDQGNGSSAYNDATWKDDDQKQKALYQELITGYGPRTFGTEFDRACPNFPGSVARDLFTKVDGPGFSGKNTLQFHYSVDMAKTDNGWQLDR